MALPAILMPVVSAIAGSAAYIAVRRAVVGGVSVLAGGTAMQGFRSAVSNVLGYALTWGSRILGWRVVQVGIFAWAMHRTVELTTDLPVSLSDIRGLYSNIIDFCDGKIIGAFPPAVQPGISFLNYFLPLSETLAVLWMLSSLYLMVMGLRITVHTLKWLDTFREAG